MESFSQAPQDAHQRENGHGAPHEAGTAAPSVLGNDALREAFAKLSATHTHQANPGDARSAEASSAKAHPASEDADKKPALPPKTVAQVFGEIVWLITQSPRHKVLPIADLEWLVMTPVLLRQFRIFYKGEQPVGVALWAMVDDAVAKRIDAGEKRLASAEWKCGAQRRIVEIVAPFGGESEIQTQMNVSGRTRK